MSEAVSVEAVWLGCERARRKVMTPNCSGVFLKAGRHVAPVAEPEKIKPLPSSAVLSLECSTLQKPLVYGAVLRMSRFAWVCLFYLDEMCLE